MSENLPQRINGVQRTPLQSLGSNLDENNMNSSSPPVSPANGSLHCKRAPDSPVLSKQENELVNYYKRFKSKVSSEEMDSDCARNLSDSYITKSESTPLSQWNGSTRNPNLKSETINAHSSGTVDDSSFICDNFVSKQENVIPSNILCKIGENSSMENGISERTTAIEPVNDSKGHLSPHCAATLEYVTQLPEGCPSNTAQAINKTEFSTADTDDDLEDDDNYLDSSEPDDNEFDNLITNNEEEESCGEDDQSVISCITVGSTSSLRSIASETVGSIYMNENGVAANEDGSPLYSSAPSASPLPSLIESLFPHVPPIVNFCQYNESTTNLPQDISRLLKWKHSTITPPIVRKTVLRSGYKITKKTILWCGIWGKHMKSTCFKAIRDYQKVNHFPGTFQIGRKDKLWKNFARFQTKYGKEEFGFMPKTFVLPEDLKSLKAAFDKEGVKKKWIVKPPASARGTGIEVVNKWNQLPVDTPVVVQRYISRPYLINNTKFDIRIYVLVTSFHPLRIFLYEDGLVRFASVQYQKDSKTLSDRFMHLTNYSVNKSSSSYTHNDDAGHCLGHKWTLKTLWGYLKAQDVDTGALWSRIADLVIKTFICGEQEIVIRTRRNTRSRYTCFEIFGIDVILDEKLRPWLLEVNISPSLHSASSLDHSVKGPLIADLLNLVGFHIPDKLTQDKQVELLKDLNLSEKTSGLCLDRRLYTRLLTPEEQAKHAKINAMPRTQYLTAALEDLYPDDVRHLVTSEDQIHNAGTFRCIFPTADTYQYFGFIEKPRYYNKLLDAWETAYSGCKEKGIELLQSLCADKVHLKVPQRFKLPKVVGSECSKSSKRRRPVLLHPQQTNHSPCSPPPGGPQAPTAAAHFCPQERENAKTPPAALATQAGVPPERSKSSPKGSSRRRANPPRRVKLRVNPLKPATVQNFLNVAAVTRGCQKPDPGKEGISISTYTESTSSDTGDTSTLNDQTRE